MSQVDFDPDEPKPKMRQLWETELEEILASSDRDSTASEKARSKVNTALYQTPARASRIAARLRSGWSAGVWMLVFLGLVILTFAVRHFSPLLGRMLALAAIVLLVVIIGRALFRPGASGTSPSQMWRGRDFSVKDDNQSWFSRVFGRKDKP